MSEGERERERERGRERGRAREGGTKISLIRFLKEISRIDGMAGWRYWLTNYTRRAHSTQPSLHE